MSWFCLLWVLIITHKSFSFYVVLSIVICNNDFVFNNYSINNDKTDESIEHNYSINNDFLAQKY